VNYVSVDRAEVVRLCVRHLAGRGCRRIGLALTDLEHSVQQARRRGYLEELAAQKLHAQEGLLWVGDQPPWPTQSDIDRTLDALVEGQKADAVIANNDYWAMGLIKGLKRRGRRVPDDVAVIGFGNLPVATLIDPELTTVDIRHELVATRTIELLVALIEEAESPEERRVCIEPELIVRGSA
jgi:DNA-binding LacI/PurR family transcriptional regulator